MNAEARVIGLDHGIYHTGYGLLIQRNHKISCLGWGTIDTSPKTAFAQRLKKIYTELIEVIQRWQPTVM